MLTEDKSIPKSCLRPELSEIFGAESGGFVSGTDIIHCSFHTMHPPFHGDVLIRIDYKYSVSYVLTQPRNFKLIRCPKLYDNSKNIKIIDYETKRSKGQIEECPY